MLNCIEALHSAGGLDEEVERLFAPTRRMRAPRNARRGPHPAPTFRMQFVALSNRRVTFPDRATIASLNARGLGN